MMSAEEARQLQEELEREWRDQYNQPVN